MPSFNILVQLLTLVTAQGKLEGLGLQETNRPVSSELLRSAETVEWHYPDVDYSPSYVSEVLATFQLRVFGWNKTQYRACRCSYFSHHLSLAE